MSTAPIDVNVRELSYRYDLLFDIKTPVQLQNEVEYLAHRLGGIARLCRDDGCSIDEYVLTVMGFPNAEIIERMYAYLAYDANCPCCLRDDECEEGCSFAEDAPQDFERMQMAREALGHNAAFMQQVED